MSACASLIFFLLGRLTPEALAPQPFTASGPRWRYTDSSNTCEIELKLTGSYGQEVLTVALILQSAAQSRLNVLGLGGLFGEGMRWWGVMRFLRWVFMGLGRPVE